MHESTRSIAVLFLAGCSFVASPAAQQDSAASVAAIREHFETRQADLTRYRKVSFYGETRADAAPTVAQLEQQRALYRRVVAAGLLENPPPEVRWLGHDLLVHDSEPPAGYLEALWGALERVAATAAGGRELRSDLYVATMAAGERGERLAVAQLDGSPAAREFAARFLGANAIYASSASVLEKRVVTASDEGTKQHLLSALAFIASPTSLPVVTSLTTAKQDDVQAAALFAYVELRGRDAIPFLEKHEPVGPKATAERANALEYLRTETSESSKFGAEVGNDAEFAARFGDLVRCPTIRWLGEQDLLSEAALESPKRLDAAAKRRLLELLLDSRGFGLEAVKGALFLGLERADEPVLLRIRAAGFHAPNDQTSGRTHTLTLLIRSIRRQL